MPGLQTRHFRLLTEALDQPNPGEVYSAVRTRVIDYRVPTQIGQVWVNPGDLVFGDIDGVVVVPREVDDEVLERALAKQRPSTWSGRRSRRGCPAPRRS